MAQKKTILLVEDNKQLNNISTRALNLFGYEVMTALNLAEARKCLAEREPDAIVLDILLPDGNGVEFCREIRQSVVAPILFLTSLEGMEHAMEGISAGGDDYLNKPYNLDLLIARIEAFWRRDDIARRLHPPETLIYGPLTLNIVASQALLGGQDMKLTQKEFALLLVLAQSEGRTLSKEYLYEKVWQQPAGVDIQVVKTHLSKVRQKLKRARCGILIIALRGEGYMFMRYEQE